MPMTANTVVRVSVERILKIPLPQDDDEFLTPVSLSIEEAYQMAETSAFEDSKTFAALMMAQKYIRNSRQKSVDSSQNE